MTNNTGLNKTIVGAAVAFIAILALSALYDHSIIWLHLLQALLYVTTIALVLRSSRWGYFLGFSIAALWNYVNLFVTHFFANGLQQLSIAVHTGGMPRPDSFIAVLAVLAHFVMIVCCVWAYARIADKKASDVAGLALTFVTSTAFFAGAIALAQPRYLPILARMLHPELHI